MSLEHPARRIRELVWTTVLPSSTVVAAEEINLWNVTSISISSASKRFSLLHISQKVETHLAFLQDDFLFDDDLDSRRRGKSMVVGSESLRRGCLTFAGELQARGELSRLQCEV